MSRQFHAFISYRHADNKQPGRQWATWLHQALETYEIPTELVGQSSRDGSKIPERIFPIFRDEDELPADSDLGQAIVRALDSSNILLVLCSPRAVQSNYVASEIDYFKKSGKANRVIAVIIDGEPNASIDEAKQSEFDASLECFPKPLQVEYEDGAPIDKRAEPLAADFRVNIEGHLLQGWTSVEALRQHLVDEKRYSASQIKAFCDAYRKQHHLMLMKIVAAILGLPLGELSQRDKAYQLAKEQARSRSLRRWLSAVGVASVLAVGFGFLAHYQRQQAQLAFEQAKAKADSLYIAMAEVAYQNGQTIDGMLYALLGKDDPGSFAALYKGLASNREVFLDAKTLVEYGVKPSVPVGEWDSNQNTDRLPEQQQEPTPHQVISQDGLVRLVETQANAKDEDCSYFDAKFSVIKDRQILASFCQPRGKLDEVRPRLSPKGNWVISQRLLQEEKALYRVKAGSLFGPAAGSPSAGLGELADEACVAFNPDEGTLAYSTFDQQVKVLTFSPEWGVSDWADEPVSLVLQAPACPVAILDDHTLVAKQSEQLRAWRLSNPFAAQRQSLFEFQYQEPGQLVADDPTGRLQAKLVDYSEQSNALQLFDKVTGTMIYEYLNVENEFLGSASGYNYPWKVEFAPSAKSVTVFGVAGSTTFPVFVDEIWLRDQASQSLPCGKEGAFVSKKTAELCAMYQGAIGH